MEIPLSLHRILTRHDYLGKCILYSEFHLISLCMCVFAKKKNDSIVSMAFISDFGKSSTKRLVHPNCTGDGQLDATIYYFIRELDCKILLIRLLFACYEYFHFQLHWDERIDSILVKTWISTRNSSIANKLGDG